MNFLGTWNLKHIANAFAIRRLRALNEGYSLRKYVCRSNYWENEK